MRSECSLSYDLRVISTTRARPLSVEERRASIIQAVIPLLLEHGQSVTSRQISEAAGVAEGTIFRAFGDKDSLIDAAVESFLSEPPTADDQLPDPDLALDDKLMVFIAGMRSRVRDVMRMAALMSKRPAPPPEKSDTLYRWRVREVFEPHVDELSLSLEELGSYLLALAIGTSVPRAEFDDAMIVRIALDGVRRHITTEHRKA